MKLSLSCMAAAALIAFGLSLAHGSIVLSLVSVICGAVGLGILAMAARRRPVWALFLWGSTFLPLSGAWIAPAFDTPLETFGVLLGLAVCGGVFYGGAAAVLSLIFRGSLRQLRFLVVPLAVPLAEYLAIQSGLVMAPVGLLAVVGGWAWSVALLGAIASGGVLVCLAAIFAETCNHRLRVLMIVAAVLVTFVPAPSQPTYAGPPVYAVAHNPDPFDKWTEDGARNGLDILIERSEAAPSQGLIVWPENAVSGTFSVEEALDLLVDVPKPILFGMTRFANAGSPTLRNSAILIDDSGVQISDKVQLAPLMETGMPFGPRSDLQSGERSLMMLNGSTSILPLICYEIAFPIAISDFEARPDIIISIAAQTGFIVWLAEAIADRHVRARELETGIRVVRVSDVYPL